MIYLFKKYLLSTSYVPNTLTDPEDKVEMTRERAMKENTGGVPILDTVVME